MKEEDYVRRFLWYVMMRYQIELLAEKKDMDFVLFQRIWNEYRDKFNDRLKFNVNDWITNNRSRYRELEIETVSRIRGVK